MGILEFYRDTDKKWRWRVVASNGRILADSGQGYRRRKDCYHGLLRTLHIMGLGNVEGLER